MRATDEEQVPSARKRIDWAGYRRSSLFGRLLQGDIAEPFRAEREVNIIDAATEPGRRKKLQRPRITALLQ